MTSRWLASSWMAFGLLLASTPDVVAAEPSSVASSQELPVSFEQTYVGTIDRKARVWVELKRNGGKLSGRYRYAATSREDLRLTGTVDESTRGFVLVETNPKGTVTGRWSGTLKSQSEVVGTWSSPDGSKRSPFSLELGRVYPPVVTLASGGKVIPLAHFAEPRGGCTSEVTYPVFEGLASRKVESALERQLRRRLGADEMFTVESCDDGNPDMPNSRESSFEVLANRGGLLSLELSRYEYTGGAHGMYGSGCVVLDLRKGEVFAVADELRPGALGTLSALTRDILLRENKVPKLSDAGFFDDTVTVSKDTTVCVTERSGAMSLEVVFQPYEVAPYAMGAPRATLDAAVARGLFKPSSRLAALFR